MDRAWTKKDCARCGKNYLQSSRTKKKTYCSNCRTPHAETMLRTTHPNLDVDYFKDIDTKEKAYWLGFFYADGYITRDQKVARLCLANKDKGLIERFAACVGADIGKLTTVHRKSTGAKYVYFSVRRREFVAHMVAAGCTNGKTFTIRLPELRDDGLALAFLLGYYDGDGTQGRSSLTCGSKEFLSDIRTRYAMKYRVKQAGANWATLYLGSDLFRKMLENYDMSLPRKRVLGPSQLRWYKEGLLVDEFGKIDESITKVRANKLAERDPQKRKFEIEAKKLRTLMISRSCESVGEEYGVSGKTVAKWCRRYDIPLPRGHRKKRGAGIMFDMRD